MRSWRGAWFAPRRLTSAGPARHARESEPSVRSLPATRRDACTLPRRRKPRDGGAFDGRREIAQDSDGGVAEPLVLVEVSADEHEVGTELPRAPSRHAASYAEGPRFVGGGEHDAAADGNRLGAQARVEQLFDRRIKGVEVRVENGGAGATHHTHHSADASRDSSSAGPAPRRSATGAPADTKRFSSVVNTRKRSKEARVKAARRAATGRR